MILMMNGTVVQEPDSPPPRAPTMQEHYSSVSGDEVRTGLGKVVALILTKPRAQEGIPEGEGGKVEQTEMRTAS